MWLKKAGGLDQPHDAKVFAISDWATPWNPWHVWRRKPQGKMSLKVLQRQVPRKMLVSSWLRKKNTLLPILQVLVQVACLSFCCFQVRLIEGHVVDELLWYGVSELDGDLRWVRLGGEVLEQGDVEAEGLDEDGEGSDGEGEALVWGALTFAWGTIVLREKERHCVIDPSWHLRDRFKSII